VSHLLEDVHAELNPNPNLNPIPIPNPNPSQARWSTCLRMSMPSIT
jgi:hypothetical protein